MADKYRNVEFFAFVVRAALYVGLALAVVGVGVLLSGCSHRQICRSMGDC